VFLRAATVIGLSWKGGPRNSAYEALKAYLAKSELQIPEFMRDVFDLPR